MIIIGTFLSILSFLGLCLLIYRRNIPTEFVPAITAASVMTFSFLGGILGILRIVCICIFALGLLSLIYFFIKSSKAKLSAFFLNPAIIFVVLSFVLLLIRFSNQRMFVFDDLSHWGKIVKCMLINNRLPDMSDSYISFKSYPPGSACWIYYICFLVGTKDSLYFAAQGLLCMAFLSSAFYYLKNTLRLLVGIVLSALIYTAVAPFCLLVDALLAASGIAAVLYLIYVYTDGNGSNRFGEIPLLCSLILIKNSGVFFVLIAIALMLCLEYKFDVKKLKAHIKPVIVFIVLAALAGATLLLLLVKAHVLFTKLISAAVVSLKVLIPLAVIAVLIYLVKRSKPGQLLSSIEPLLIVVIPFAILLIWQLHVRAVFPDGMSSKHSMSMENYMNTLVAVNRTWLKAMLLSIFSWIFSIRNKTIILLASYCILSLLLIRKDRSQANTHISFLIAISVCVGLYQLGILLMYICSMSYYEFVCQNGADYFRYNSTIVSFTALVGYCFYSVQLFKQSEAANKLKFALLSLVLVLSLLPQSDIKILFAWEKSPGEYKLDYITQGIEDGSFPLGGSYLLYTAKEDEREYSYYAVGSYFLSGDVTLVTEMPSEQQISQYDLFIDWGALPSG